MKIIVLGGGESGVGAAILASLKGYDVFLSDAKNISQKYKNKLDKYNILYEENTHSLPKILESDEVIKSPGIPDNIEIIKKIKNKGIPVISEIEFAYRYTNAKIIAITGSNGKTTTTTMMYEVLKKEGVNVGVSGNIGDSFAYQVATQNFAVYVLELSSFQLDGIVKFKPDIAILLNITPDHLDRYENNMNKYIQSKFRICKNQIQNDHLIYNADDENITHYLNKNKIICKKNSFSISQKLHVETTFIENKILKSLNGFEIPLKKLSLKGKHNVKNAMAVSIASLLYNVKKENLTYSLRNFQNVEHRMEKVLKIKGISFINDSKATNVDATYYALETINKNIIWIAGGVDKGNDYESLLPFIDKIKILICLGKDNQKLKSFFAKKIPKIIETQQMDEVVKSAFEYSKNQDTVLLSPACASFDLFKSYEDRGTQFKKYVTQLSKC